MPRLPLHPDFEKRLQYLEARLLRYGRGRSGYLPEARNHLVHLWEYLRESPYSRILGPDGRENLMSLRHRIERAHTWEEIRELVRDIKQFSMSVSSFAQARELEERLHDLESQVKTAAEVSAVEPAKPEDNVVTIESLKKKKLLFAIMPFHEDFSDVWTGGVQRAASGTGLSPIRIDSITKSSEITDDIVSVIKMSEVVVVDVTGNNPNVMFEFGFALALKKPHVVISQSTGFLTFDIKNVRTVIYRNTWKGIEELHKELQKFIKGAIGDKSKKK